MKRTFYPDFFQGSRRVEMVYTCILGQSLGLFFVFLLRLTLAFISLYYLLGGGGYNTQVFRVIISLGMNCINMS